MNQKRKLEYKLLIKMLYELVSGNEVIFILID